MSPKLFADSPRVDLLRDAARAITGDRNNAYGPPTQDFDRSAGALNALGYTGPNGRPLQPHDVAIMISCVKLSRLMWSPEHRDSWLDLAGYAACGHECVSGEDQTVTNATSEESRCTFCGEVGCTAYQGE